MTAIQTPPQLITLPKLNSPQLTLTVGCDRNFQSFARHQYAAYPFRLSRCFRFDAEDPRRAYFYLMNASPGVLAQDNLALSIQLNAHSQLYFTDQSALKVHSMPIAGTSAQVTHQVVIRDQAYLEYVPEPIILFPDAELIQQAQVTLHPTARLFWSEMILPGRLARQECYDFRQYRSRLQVHAPDGTLLFCDAMVLTGQGNPFKQEPLFCALPAMGNVVTVLPGVDLDELTALLSTFEVGESQPLQASYSRLPNCNGLLIRAIAESTSNLKAYINFALRQVRQLTHQPPLPEVPK